MGNIRVCGNEDTPEILFIINEAARVYENAIPADCWHEPYMPRAELERELAAGVRFWGYEDGNELTGIMGIQLVQDVALIRHAYVRTRAQRTGIGGRLMHHILSSIDRPVDDALSPSLIPLGDTSMILTNRGSKSAAFE